VAAAYAGHSAEAAIACSAGQFAGQHRADRDGIGARACATRQRDVADGGVDGAGPAARRLVGSGIAVRVDDDVLRYIVAGYCFLAALQLLLGGTRKGVDGNTASPPRGAPMSLAAW
jgi:hypothetical protein